MTKGVSEIGLLQEAETLFTEYANEVNHGRALPQLYDGLKPVHRFILYAMLNIGAKPDSTPVKCARVVGDVIGKYHPHGDAAAYGALVNMSGTTARHPVKHLLHPLIEGHGNYGSGVTMDDTASPAAGMRYTECRLTPLAMQLLDKEYMAVVPHATNYDGTLSYPLFLPAKVPLLFFNGSIGPGVALAHTLPAFNSETVMLVVQKVLAEPDMTDEALAAFMADTLRYRYRYGGSADMTAEQMLASTYRLRVTADHVCNRDEIQVTGVPTYSTTLAGMMAIAASLENTALVRDDTSAEKGVMVTLKAKRGLSPVDLQKWRDDVRKALTASEHMRHHVIVHGNPTILRCSLVELMRKWVAFRKALERKVLESRAVALEGELHRVDARLIACLNLDTVFQALRQNNVKPYLMEHLNLSEEQADVILSASVTSLSKDNVAQHEKKQRELRKAIPDARRTADHVARHLQKTLPAG